MRGKCTPARWAPVSPPRRPCAACPPGVEEARRHVAHPDRFLLVDGVLQTSRQAADTEPNAPEVGPERLGPQRAGIVDGLDVRRPRRHRDRGEPEGAQIGEHVVVVRRTVCEIPGAVPAHLATLRVEDEHRRPGDPAAIIRVPEIQLLATARRRPDRCESGTADANAGQARRYVPADRPTARRRRCRATGSRRTRSPTAPAGRSNTVTSRRGWSPGPARRCAQQLRDSGHVAAHYAVGLGRAARGIIVTLSSRRVGVRSGQGMDDGSPTLLGSVVGLP